MLDDFNLQDGKNISGVTVSTRCPEEEEEDHFGTLQRSRAGGDSDDDEQIGSSNVLLANYYVNIVTHSYIKINRCIRRGWSKYLELVLKS